MKEKYLDFRWNLSRRIKYVPMSLLVWVINKKFKFTILSDRETINEIILNKKSIARYGDGEFRWMLMCDDVPGFQKPDEELQKKLIDVIKKGNTNNLLLCIPKVFNDYKNKTFECKFFWKRFLIKYYDNLSSYLNGNNVYGNANVSRFYMDYRNKKKSFDRINYFKKVWDNKKILIVEGEKSRLGVGNDLFNNSKSVSRVLCPSTNAFDKYDEIFEYVKKVSNKYDIVLFALGPTATILAAELSEYIQCIDIGHIDIEYEWCLKNVKKKIAIDGKYVNEVGSNGGNFLPDKMYLKQVVKKIL